MRYTCNKIVKKRKETGLNRNCENYSAKITRKWYNYGVSSRKGGACMTKTTLVIMAAGLGSRFGGIKQLEPVGPNGEIIMDYSIFDAIEAGFSKVVFIIRKDIEEDFKEIIGNRVSEKVETEYVFQDLNNLPTGFTVPEGREKPWGTGQAVLSIKGVVDGPFAVINADDYYGKEAFVKVNQYLQNPEDTDKRYNFCMAGFRLGNTLSENGTVTRGICEVDDNHVLLDVNETFEIERDGDYAKAVRDGKNLKISLDQPASMNMWGFTAEFIDELDKRFVEFLSGIAGNEMKAEYLLPSIVDDLIKEGSARVKVLDTKDKWFGVTYQEDKFIVRDSLKR